MFVRSRRRPGAPSAPRDKPAAPSGGARPISWVGIGYLLVVYVVWGSTYLAIRVAVREGAGFPAVQHGRHADSAGGEHLVALGRCQRPAARLGRRELVVLAGSGLLLWVGGNGLVVWAEQRADSSYAALLVSSAPVWVALVEAALTGARRRRC